MSHETGFAEFQEEDPVVVRRAAKRKQPKAAGDGAAGPEGEGGGEGSGEEGGGEIPLNP